MSGPATRGWIADLPGQGLFLVCLGAYALLFGFGAGYWWFAGHFAWWTFALLYAAGPFVWGALKAIPPTVRKRGRS